jgi:hypothetical protein
MHYADYFAYMLLQDSMESNNSTTPTPAAPNVSCTRWKFTSHVSLDDRLFNNFRFLKYIAARLAVFCLYVVLLNSMGQITLPYPTPAAQAFLVPRNSYLMSLDGCAQQF